MTKNEAGLGLDFINPEKHGVWSQVIADVFLAEKAIGFQLFSQLIDVAPATVQEFFAAVEIRGVEMVIKKPIVIHEHQHGVVHLVELDQLHRTIQRRARQRFFNAFTVVLVLDHSRNEVNVQDGKVLPLILFAVFVCQSTLCKLFDLWSQNFCTLLHPSQLFG